MIPTTPEKLYFSQKTLCYHEKQFPEATTGVFCKTKMFLKISKVLQENTCVGVYF